MANGTITDMDGNYMLNNVLPSGNLVISYVGMQNQTINVDSKITIDVILAEEIATLNELVVSIIR